MGGLTAGQPATGFIALIDQGIDRLKTDGPAVHLQPDRRTSAGSMSCCWRILHPRAGCRSQMRGCSSCWRHTAVATLAHRVEGR